MRRLLPRPARRVARQIWTVINAFKARVRLAVGLQPLSLSWGYDRGTPILRYYLEQFLEEFSTDIRGHCLEFQSDDYMTRFGKSAVDKLDILHIDGSNPKATIVADLTKPNSIPSNEFDCIICTHVLHVIFELHEVVSELHRILKPGGVLLTAVPHFSMYVPECHEFWRFTPQGLSSLLAKVFGAENVTIRAYGNSLTAAGQIRGMVAHEFTKTELSYQDLHFPSEICARAVRNSPNDMATLTTGMSHMDPKSPWMD
jgi:SAM-dependent methyltransferase